MANTKISELSELTSVDNADVLVIVDDSASETKKISFANLSSGISVGNATELQFTAKNITGSTIAAGKAVYVSGASGSDTTIALAANTSAATMPAFGITKDAIANNASGVVVLAGSLAGINTSSFSEGDELYVSTAGDLTDTKPTGTALIQKIAKVAKAAASGTVIVTGAGRTNDLPNLADNYLWVGDSNGVPAQVEGPNANGELLIGGTSGLSAATLTAGSNVTITNGDGTITIAATGTGGATALNDLTDVTVTTPAVGQVLIYDATNSIFENNTLTAGPNVKITEADGAITIGAGDGQELELKVRESAVSAAGEVEGTIVKFGTTTGMTAGDVYCWNGTNWVQVDADAEATTKGLLGVALGTTSDVAGLLVHGVGYLSHDPGTAGDVLYVSTTAGQVSATQPGAGKFVRVAGYCLADNKVFFSPSQDYIEVAT